NLVYWTSKTSPTVWNEPVITTVDPLVEASFTPALISPTCFTFQPFSIPYRSASAGFHARSAGALGGDVTMVASTIGQRILIISRQSLSRSTPRTATIGRLGATASRLPTSVLI